MARRTTYPGRRSTGVMLPGEMWDALQDAAYARDMSRNLLMTLILRDWLRSNTVRRNTVRGDILAAGALVRSEVPA